MNLTVDDLIAQLRVANGFVIATTNKNGMSRCVALLPQTRVISSLMFAALGQRGVLKGVSRRRKNGEITRTYKLRIAPEAEQ